MKFFEEIIRNSLEKFEMPYDNADWLRLKDSLTKSKPVISNGAKIAATVVVIAGLTYLYNTHKTVTTVSTPVVSESINKTVVTENTFVKENTKVENYNNPLTTSIKKSVVPATKRVSGNNTTQMPNISVNIPKTDNNLSVYSKVKDNIDKKI